MRCRNVTLEDSLTTVRTEAVDTMRRLISTPKLPSGKKTKVEQVMQCKFDTLRYCLMHMLQAYLCTKYINQPVPMVTIVEVTAYITNGKLPDVN